MNCIQGPGSPLAVTHNRRQKIKMSTANNNEISADPITLDNAAVFIRDLCKSYGGPPVIENLNMNVRKGTIYGLLGASGSGKTTLLSVITSLIPWDSGDVLVFGKRPGTKENRILGKLLGYMPQGISLYDTLTVPEMISLYGKIYNMSSSEVEHSMQFLITLLQLPPKKQLIRDLSGGQRRRVSLALALVHAPDLLILDEPTVGLDPLLRRSIWNHLYKIVSTRKTTVIITTHYIEEARFSDLIGILRNGRMLVQDVPTNLLHTFKCDLLEQVVLKLCRADESNIKKLSNTQVNSEGNNLVFKSNWKQDVSSVFNQDELDGIFRKAVGFDCEISDNLQKIDLPKRKSSFLLRARNHQISHSIQRIQGFSLAIWLQFMRHPLFMAFLIILPTFQGTIMLAAIGTKPTGMRVGVVSHEMLNWTTGCSELDLNSCDFSFLSCHFIKQMKMDDVFDLRQYNSEHQARADVQLGQLWGYITFQSNYSQHTVDLITAGRFAENETLEGSRIRMYLDMSQYIGSFYMIKNTFAAFEGFVQQLAEACNIGHNATKMPIHFRKPVYGSLVDGYTEFMIPGTMFCNLITIVSVMTSFIHIADRKGGTLSRALVAGLTTLNILISHIITQVALALVQIVLWSLTCYLMVGFTVKGQAWLYFLIYLTAGFCGASLGMLEGVLCSNEVESMIFTIFLTSVFMFYGDLFWPVESMSKFWQTVASALPTTLPTQSMRSVITRGLGITHELVYPGVIVIVIWTLVFSICVIILFKRSVN